ncbi:MAG: tartrate dehydrogenase [Armatimonadota bacterium]|nr:tartrate dehydrogenase [Armatimonadota bacterium]MDR7452140.1 tartrate dehydrogenase [Armatimonadota bacterium]MDR7467864.1 tartrate dehydrogenase [Armatimonadota bacterium]MDR7494752.1 tartrate dehydrogenase [Armatimonadota bacterium]MDR7499577.1 tartrate dehydrogenase [Armatimonadota bacterium]
MRRYRLAVIPGDGIGREVIPEGLKVLHAAGRRFGFTMEAEEFPWGCEYYLRHGVMMPTDGLVRLRDHDAIYLGAIGDPRVPDHVSLWGLLLRIRKAFDQYANVRPIRLLEGIPSPLAGRAPSDVDILFVRENTEGEYAGVGGRVHQGTPDEVALQTSVFTRRGTERILRYAFELARSRRRRLAHITKSNALQYTAVLWDEVAEVVARDYPDVQVWKLHVDAAAYQMVLHPERFDVMVGSNLFADILTDLGAALQGSLGLAASANLDPTRRHPSMFEPVHGSAPDIAGKNIANPMAAIWTASLMLEHLGEGEAAGAVFEALRRVVRQGEFRTPDLGGRHTTQAVGNAVVEALGA